MKLIQSSLLPAAFVLAGYAVVATPVFADPAPASAAAGDMTPPYAKTMPLWGVDAMHSRRMAPSDAMPATVSVVSIDAIRSLVVGMTQEQVIEVVGTPAVRGEQGLWKYAVEDASGKRYMASVWFNAAGRLWQGDASNLAQQAQAAPSQQAQAAPALQVVAKGQPNQYLIQLKVAALFPFGSDVLPSTADELDKVVEWLHVHQGVSKLTIAGYTDRLGSDQANQALSERRAQAVRRYLSEHGVPNERMEAVGRGNSSPMVGCAGVKPQLALVECLAPNRRVEIVTS